VRRTPSGGSSHETLLNGTCTARDGMQDSIAYSREVIADLSKPKIQGKGVNAFVEKRKTQLRSTNNIRKLTCQEALYVT